MYIMWQGLSNLPLSMAYLKIDDKLKREEVFLDLFVQNVKSSAPISRHLLFLADVVWNAYRLKRIFSHPYL
jgi:hypothetical protein